MAYHDLEASAQQVIDKHLSLVVKANESVNLTRITSPEDAFVLHIEDSLSALPEIDKAPSGLYGDLGSGAGYPGIPLAVASGRTTYLIDARQKKMEQVQLIINELGLQDQIFTIGGRAELVARKMAGQFAVLTARALAKLPVLLELASPLLMKGGRLICFKSNLEDDELARADKTASLTGMRLMSDRSFILLNEEKHEEFQRRLITYEKVSQSKVKLPRQEGLAQKQPLA